MANSPKNPRKATDKSATKPAGSTTPRKPRGGQAQGLSGTEALEKTRERMGGPAPAAPKPASTPAAENPAVAGGQIVTEADGTMRGGTKNVKITIRKVLSRGGLNTQRAEEYPFTDLPLSVKGTDGEPEGPSFFIPKSDNPDQKVATARKRFRGKDVAFVTRKANEVVEGQEDKGVQPGLLIWKAKKGEFK